jgi:TatA/E family protein of Tat protein translocase
MFNIGPLELVVILVVALLVVGPQKLPEVGRSIGQGIREFRKAQEEVRRSLRSTLQDDDGQSKRPARPKRTPGASSAPVSSGNGPGTADGAADEVVTAADLDTPASGQDIAKTIGRGLAELRKAREDLQQSFRVDIDDPEARD